MPSVEGGFVTGEQMEEILRLMGKEAESTAPEEVPQTPSFNQEEWEERVRALQRKSVTAGGTQVVDRRGR